MPAVVMTFLTRVARDAARRATPAPRSSSAIRTRRPPRRRSFARRLFGIAEETGARVARRRSADGRAPARPRPGSTATTRRSPRSGGRCRPAGGARTPRSSRSSRCGSCPTYPGDERLDFGLLRAVLRERAGARADDARGDLRGGRVSFSVVIPTYRRPETLFPVLDALGGQERAARVRGRRRRRRLGRRDARRGSRRTVRPIRSASSRRRTRARPPRATAACARRAASVILFLGDDTVPEPGLLAVHARAHARAAARIRSRSSATRPGRATCRSRRFSTTSTSTDCSSATG